MKEALEEMTIPQNLIEWHGMIGFVKGMKVSVTLEEVSEEMDLPPLGDPNNKWECKLLFFDSYISYEARRDTLIEAKEWAEKVIRDLVTCGE